MLRRILNSLDEVSASTYDLPLNGQGWFLYVSEVLLCHNEVTSLKKLDFNSLVFVHFDVQIQYLNDNSYLKEPTQYPFSNSV